MGSTEAGVTSALWGSAMDNRLPWAENLLLELLFLCSYYFSHQENTLFEGRTSQKLYEGDSLGPADNWNARFAKASKAFHLFLRWSIKRISGFLPYFSNHFFALRLVSEIPNPAGRLARAWCSRLRLQAGVCRHTITQSLPDCSLRDLLLDAHSTRNRVSLPNNPSFFKSSAMALWNIKQ